MDEFEKIKTFSESLTERQQNIEMPQPQSNSEVDLPKYLSQFRAVPVQEEKDSKRLLAIVLGLCCIVAVAGIVALTYRLPAMEEGEIVVISPTTTPVKVLPENPGGLNIPDKDKVVYDRVAVTEPMPVVESDLPEPEQPLLPRDMIEPENREDVSPVEEVLLPEPINEHAIDATSDAIEEPVVPVETPSNEEVTEEKQQPVVSKEKEESQPQKKVPAQETVVWKAQLLSSASKDKVESSWKTISKSNAALLSDMPYKIVSATIPGKGTFWRLQVGEFSTKEMALNLCEKLKKKKQDCIPVK